MKPGLPRLTLLWKLLLATSVSITLLFGLAGWVMQRHAISSASATLDEEVKASLRAYEELWRSRARTLATVSVVISNMSDVRAAFSTGDKATIADTARELWQEVSDENAIFLVTDATGNVIASLGGHTNFEGRLAVVRAASRQFPRQASGFMTQEGALYQVVVTPVYLQTGNEKALWNVLVAGFVVDETAAQALKTSTGGSEFVFSVAEKVLASTLGSAPVPELPGGDAVPARVRARRSDGRTAADYVPLRTVLPDVEGRPMGKLWILRPSEATDRSMAVLRRNLALLWVLSLAIGLLLSYLLARKIVRPVRQLVEAAEAVAQQRYDHRVPVSSADELGLLARTFNSMCESIRNAQDELVRQERISTIARLAASIVHDLRNPLTAVYAGSEMLAQSELPPHHVRRLGGSIFRAAKSIQQMLQDLLDISRQKTGQLHVCTLAEVAEAARDSVSVTAERQNVDIRLDVPEELELPMERARMERVFMNLFGNALQVMPNGGSLRVVAQSAADEVRVSVEDTGPGIPAEIRDTLFKPFTTAGKKNGLGLGLALSRQTIKDHGGDMWVEQKEGKGACFVFRLPLKGERKPALIAAAR